MLTLLWFAVALAVVVAGAAWLRLRYVAKELADLTKSYWALRYEHGQLASRIYLVETRNGPAAPRDELPTPANERTAFVPLSSLKKSS